MNPPIRNAMRFMYKKAYEGVYLKINACKSVIERLAVNMPKNVSVCVCTHCTCCLYVSWHIPELRRILDEIKKKKVKNRKLYDRLKTANQAAVY